MSTVTLRQEHLTRHKKFIQVNVALIAALGGDGNAAILLTAIEFWTEYEGEAHEDGHTWWRANRDKLSEKTGFTADKVRRLVEKLVKVGALEVRQLDLWDRTYSYRIVLADGEIEPPSPGTRMRDDAADDVETTPEGTPEMPDDAHLANPPLPSGGSASSTSGESATWHVADSPDDPLYRGKEGREAPAAPPTPTLDRPFPEQCERHQDAENDEPCHGCRRARQRVEAYRAEQAARRRREPDLTCPHHGTKYPAGAVCPGCRADQLAAS